MKDKNDGVNMTDHALEITEKLISIADNPNNEVNLLWNSPGVRETVISILEISRTDILNRPEEWIVSLSLLSKMSFQLGVYMALSAEKTKKLIE